MPNDETENDYYKILGVSESASDEEIKKEYRQLARKLHSDIHPELNDAEFREIAEAYEVLSSPSQRKAYDAKRRAGREAAKQQQEASERAKQAKEARQARARQADQARNMGDAFRKQASPWEEARPSNASSTASTGGSSPAQPPVTPPPELSPQKDDPPLPVAWCVAAVSMIGLAVGAIVGAAHPGSHLPGNPLFAPFAFLCLIGCPAGAFAVKSGRPEAGQWSFGVICICFAALLILPYMLGVLISHGGHFPSMGSG